MYKQRRGEGEAVMSNKNEEKFIQKLWGVLN